jgi:hypothetical protein
MTKGEIKPAKRLPSLGDVTQTAELVSAIGDVRMGTIIVSAIGIGLLLLVGALIYGYVAQPTDAKASSISNIFISTVTGLLGYLAGRKSKKS